MEPATHTITGISVYINAIALFWQGYLNDCANLSYYIITVNGSIWYSLPSRYDHVNVTGLSPHTVYDIIVELSCYPNVLSSRPTKTLIATLPVNSEPLPPPPAGHDNNHVDASGSSIIPTWLIGMLVVVAVVFFGFGLLVARWCMAYKFTKSSIQFPDEHTGILPLYTEPSS